MSLNDFINKAWDEHHDKTEEVADRLLHNLNLIHQSEDIPGYAQIVTHVYGEHLGKWVEGSDILKSLQKMSLCDEKGNAVIIRCVAMLDFISGKLENLDEFDRSDQIRVLAMTASALSQQNRVADGINNFKLALDLAENGLEKDDPANVGLAVAGNNLACSLEEKESRTSEEVDLMLLAARTARKYWEIAGTWIETERAEYRLAMSHLKAGDKDLAYSHAKKCLEISTENKAPALELFFANEALAIVEKARGNEKEFSTVLNEVKMQFQKLSEADKSWCKASLDKLSKIEN